MSQVTKFGGGDTINADQFVDANQLGIETDRSDIDRNLAWIKEINSYEKLPSSSGATDDQVLTIVSGEPTWADQSQLPSGNEGDLLYYTDGGGGGDWEADAVGVALGIGTGTGIVYSTSGVLSVLTVPSNALLTWNGTAFGSEDYAISGGYFLQP